MAIARGCVSYGLTVAGPIFLFDKFDLKEFLVMEHAFHFLSGCAAGGSIELTVAKAYQYSALSAGEKKHLVSSMAMLYRRCLRTLPLNMVGGGIFFSTFEAGHHALAPRMNPFLADLFVAGSANILTATALRPVGLAVTQGPSALRHTPLASLFRGLPQEVMWTAPAMAINMACFSATMNTLSRRGIVALGGVYPSVAASAAVGGAACHITVGSVKQFVDFVHHSRSGVQPADPLKLGMLLKEWVRDPEERAEWTAELQKEVLGCVVGGIAFTAVNTALCKAFGK